MCGNINLNRVFILGIGLFRTFFIFKYTINRYLLFYTVSLDFLSKYDIIFTEIFA